MEKELNLEILDIELDNNKVIDEAADIAAEVDTVIFMDEVESEVEIVNEENAN